MMDLHTIDRVKINFFLRCHVKIEIQIHKLLTKKLCFNQLSFIHIGNNSLFIKIK